MDYFTSQFCYLAMIKITEQKLQLNNKGRKHKNKCKWGQTTKSYEVVITHPTIYTNRYISINVANQHLLENYSASMDNMAVWYIYVHLHLKLPFTRQHYSVNDLITSKDQTKFPGYYRVSSVMNKSMTFKGLPRILIWQLIKFKPIPVISRRHSIATILLITW
jgi:hypothetical protein